MDDFDERHYFAPRVDRTPGYLYTGPQHRLSLGQWLLLGVAVAVLITGLWATGCDGAVWCSR
jgi:hypothetical protein